MSHVSVHIHLVFGTKDHKKLIASSQQPKLWAYIAGIASNYKMDALAIGGMEEHIHGLVGMPPTLSIAKVAQVIKANSSRWMRQQVPAFAWQEKYGAFSVSRSDIPAVADYIRHQAEHHKKRDFKTEFEILLRKHGLNPD